MGQSSTRITALKLELCCVRVDAPAERYVAVWRKKLDVRPGAYNSLLDVIDAEGEGAVAVYRERE